MNKRTIDNRTAFGAVRDLLLSGETVRVGVCGQSMLPFFRSGEVIRVRPLREGDLRRGSVVLAQTEQGNYVIHRIYRIEEERITLLGDGNLHGTEQIDRPKIYGTVDCGRVHRLLALAWMALRPLRRYPLGILRRVCRR